MKRILALVIAGALAVSLAPSGAFAQAKGQPSENANPLAQERAGRNSAGGDRNPSDGGTNFGQVQSEFVQANQPFGQWLQEWKEAAE